MVLFAMAGWSMRRSSGRVDRLIVSLDALAGTVSALNTTVQVQAAQLTQVDLRAGERQLAHDSLDTERFRSMDERLGRQEQHLEDVLRRLQLAGAQPLR